MPNPWSIGRYEVTALIGKGGMGTVYRAMDPRTGRDVAIKLLRHGEATQNPELLNRFVREIKLARSLSHPNVVTVLDDGEHQGLPYFVMELVSGETLEAVIKRTTQLALVVKLRLMEEVCAGLAHAHQANIVHRDIKPANLMVGPEGTLKILDFGIARPLDSNMTMYGVVMGTPNYMSPEQARGDAIDAGTDIFAAGAVLYELITTKKAFPGAGYEDVRRRILNSSHIRLDEACPGIDPRLVDIVEQALQKSRDRRFRSIAVLQGSLADVRLSLTESARQPAEGQQSGTFIVGVLTPPMGSMPRATPDRENLAKQHERHIAIRLAAAEQALKSGDPEAAMRSCGQALMLNPADARAAALLERANQAIEDRQAAQQREIAERRREETIRAAIAKARALLEAGDPAAARREVDRVLAIDSRSEEALGLSATIDRALADARERTRIETGLAEASRRFTARDYAGAIAILERLQPTADARVSDTLDLLRHSFAAIEEQRRTEAVRAGLARAQAISDQGDHATALREIEEILSQNPAEAEAADAGALKATIARAMAAKLERERQALLEQQRADAERAERLERQHRVAILIDEARALIEARSFEAAQTRLDAARAIDAAQPEIDVLYSRAAHALDEKKHREQQRLEAEAEARRLEEQRREIAAEVQRLEAQRREAAAEAERLEQLRREAAAAAEQEKQRREEAAAEARRREQQRLESEATLKHAPPAVAAEPTLKRPAAREKAVRQMPPPKPDRSGDYAQRPVIDAHISQAAKFAQRHEFRMAIAELEAARAIKPDHVGLNSLIAKMREAEAARLHNARPLADLTLHMDRPVEAIPLRPAGISKTAMIAGAIAILALAAMILFFANR